MEAESRPGRRRRAEDEEEGRSPRERREGDTIVLRLPQIDPELRDWLWEMLPGRALLRVLRDMPDDVVVHARNARRERLLAMRSFIDALIEDTERPRRRRRAREIEIE